LSHSDFAGDTPFPTETTTNVNISFSYVLLSDFSSVYALATSNDFIEKIGNLTNIQTVADSCDGTTLTDQVNCALPNNLDALTKLSSGIFDNGEPIQIITTPGSTQIGLQFQAMRYVNDVSTPTQNVYEYYEIIFSVSLLSRSSKPKKSS